MDFGSPFSSVMDQKNVTTTAVAVASVAAIAMYLVVTKKLVKVKGELLRVVIMSQVTSK